MSTSKQHKLIIKHLRTTKGITVREAMIEYSISSLTSRVCELRRDGYPILSTTKRHPVTKQRYVRYTLLEEA
jgi:hypothetical protein